MSRKIFGGHACVTGLDVHLTEETEKKNTPMSDNSNSSNGYALQQPNGQDNHHQNGESATAKVSSPSSSTRRTPPRPSSSSLSMKSYASCSSSVTESPSSSNANGTLSVSKTINALLSVSTNRRCADCRSQLVDSSQIFVSFSPTLGGRNPTAIQQEQMHRQRSTLVDFRYHHNAFAPPQQQQQRNLKPGLSSKSLMTMDPSAFVAYSLGGHAVFVCRACAAAHQQLGTTITRVQSVSDLSVWTTAQARFVSSPVGGNAVSWRVYEAFVPPPWQPKRPNSQSNAQERLAFCRAKYDALAFLIPTGGPVARDAWIRILNRQQNHCQQWFHHSLRSYSLLSFQQHHHHQQQQDSNHNNTSDRTMDSSVSSVAAAAVELPKRLVDFFCVIGHDQRLYSGGNNNDKRNSGWSGGVDSSPQDVSLAPILVDCYPPQDTHEIDFPEHVSTFVFPHGCRVSESQQTPTFFTFVLTTSSGCRLYCAALQIYDETMETTDLAKILLSKTSDGSALPWWLQDKPTTTQDGRRPPDLLYLPKCLVLVSHYAFFDLWKTFLKQLYRITLAEAPLPVERYIANFVREVPLPPQGRIQLNFGYTHGTRTTVSRPAPNELPLVDFSYKPLFQSLCVGNIMVIMGCLMKETRVALCSSHTALLTPCAEALLSLLFPFEWQGMYIPVMPFAMVDILDAPVPFLVGLDSRYLAQVEAKRRPHGVVFVDLDKDNVHLGFQETHGPYAEHTQTPHLPDRDAAKLKQRLEEFGGHAFLMPVNGIKGMITVGDDELLQNKDREPYARMEITEPTSVRSDRSRVLAECDKAFDDNLKDLEGFLSQEGHIVERSDRTEATVEKKSKQRKLNKVLKRFSVGAYPSPASSIRGSVRSSRSSATVSQSHVCSCWLSPPCPNCAAFVGRCDLFTT